MGLGGSTGYRRGHGGDLGDGQKLSWKLTLVTRATS